MNKNRNGFHFHKLSAEAATEAVQMYERGLSLAPIAAFFGVSRQSMWDLLRRRTAMRPQRRQGIDNNMFRGGPCADDRAQNLAEQAINAGVLARPNVCSKCGGTGPRYKDGRSGIHGHHDDYNKPLDVRWLCQPCHLRWHRENKPIMRRES